MEVVHSRSTEEGWEFSLVTSLWVQISVFIPRGTAQRLAQQSAKRWDGACGFIQEVRRLALLLAGV